MNAPIKVREQLPRTVRFDLKEIKQAVADVEGFNAKVALVITRSVGCQGSREFPTCDHGNSPPWDRVESAGRMALMASRWARIR